MQKLEKRLGFWGTAKLAARYNLKRHPTVFWTRVVLPVMLGLVLTGMVVAIALPAVLSFACTGQANVANPFYLALGGSSAAPGPAHPQPRPPPLPPSQPSMWGGMEHCPGFDRWGRALMALAVLPIFILTWSRVHSVMLKPMSEVLAEHAQHAALPSSKHSGKRGYQHEVSRDGDMSVLYIYLQSCSATSPKSSNGAQPHANLHPCVRRSWMTCGTCARWPTSSGPGATACTQGASS